MIDDFSFFFVVPTLNSCRLLPRLLQSFQSQTCSSWRILFVDGPSSIQHRRYLENCALLDPRCSWTQQESTNQGIFGAMNQGFAACDPTDYLCFWGSDDWLPRPTVLEELAACLRKSRSKDFCPDLIVCCGRYINISSGAMSRQASFTIPGYLSMSEFRKSLFMGSTPPHQASLIGPNIRAQLGSYSSCYCLSADLDYFLRLSAFSGFLVECIDLELVYMSDGGVSGQLTRRRLIEVRRAYRLAFGWYWWFPFFMRYLRRVASLLEWSR